MWLNWICCCPSSAKVHGVDLSTIEKQSWTNVSPSWLGFTSEDPEGGVIQINYTLMAGEANVWLAGPVAAVADERWI